MSTTATATKQEPAKPETKLSALPVAKSTMNDWFARRALDECFNWGREVKRGSKDGKPHTVDVLVGFWSNHMSSGVMQTPCLPPQEAIILAECSIVFENRLPSLVTIHRVMDRQTYDNEMRAIRDAKRQ